MDDRDDAREDQPRRDPKRRSASADAAALRMTEREPDSEVAGAPAEKDEPGPPERGGRPSASAEAAALRWRDEHPDD